ncbi:hypothetical protein [Phytohabitans houttuyneae]|uniref:Uncharacterized protein n=1 Tax=Phytohabitans houttuyneae TaxID=1076126 RepID=A0A6V8KQZ2_9ACTN|nr:hypothetical protein [Phytohabitans houttuyneae]GFJ84286.1 hypothetical protein Phou_084660 [Phytohabitans houttuyneae]
MSPLEARYRRLLRLYPADYRAERGEEMVGTYLQMVRNGQRWPRAADVADLVAGSLRQRVRAAGPAFAGGRHAAAVLALATAGALAAIWLLYVELTGERHFGPFRGLGGLVWLAWLAAAVLPVASSGRAHRWTVAGALAATVAVVPVSALVPVDRPALMELLPQFALGVVALGLDGRGTRANPAVPAVATSVTAAVLLLFCLPYSPLPAGFGVSYGYRAEVHSVAPAAGALLAAAGLACAALLRARGLWALTLLATPVALCFVEPVARRISGKRPWNPADFDDLVLASVGLTGVAVVVVLGLQVAARRASA